MTATATGPVTRFRKSNPCPICGGGDDMPRGKGQRCSGYLSSDGRFAYCTREEHAGMAALEPTDPASYRHILEGECRCGQTHSLARERGDESSWSIYDYVDQFGNLRFQVVRKPGKKFLQRRPDPDEKDGWAWNLRGVERLLYKADDLWAAQEFGTTDLVYIVEGEKDVAAVAKAGALATTNPGGEGKWRPEYSEQLRGFKRAVIVADRDDVGVRHALNVAEALRGIIETVEIVQAAAGKDAADHLNAGHTLAELEPLSIEQTDQEPAHREDPTVTLEEFVARKPDDDQGELIACEQGTILLLGALALVAGKTSAGKTTWIVDFLLHAAAGVDYCGFTFPRPLRILVIENEGPREGFRQKLEARTAHGPNVERREPIRIWDDQARWGTVRVSDEDTRAQLRTAIERHSTDIVVSDTLTRFGMTGNGTPEETRDFMVLLSDAGLGRNVAFLILAHTRTRTDTDDELEQIAGAWAPHADAILMLKKLDGNRARLSVPKARWTRGQVPAGILAFDTTTETFTLVATDAEKPDAVSDETYEKRILDWLAEHPWATTDEVAKGVEGRAEEIRKARQRLQKAGRVTSAQSADLGLGGGATRWNTPSSQGYSPVPLPGTGRDGEGPEPSQAGNPVRGVPPLRGDTRRDGAAGQANDDPDHDQIERLHERHADIANSKPSPALPGPATPERHVGAARADGVVG